MNWTTKNLKGILWRVGVNGCGVFGIKPPLWRKYQACCELHDAMYDLGGDGKERFRSDKRLLMDMVERSTGSWLMMWCFVYYLSVRMFGWLFFNYKVASHNPSKGGENKQTEGNNLSTRELKN